jgi:peptide/nickel transport system substrate-binding protein
LLVNYKKEVIARDKCINVFRQTILFNLLPTKNSEEKKIMKKQLYVLVAIIMAASMFLSACGAAATTAAPATAAPATAAPATAAPATAAPTAVPPTATEAPLAPGAALPRNETLYFNGQQWGTVVCWNPYSSNCNNAMAIAEQDNARVTMFETPYLYDMMDGKSVSSAGRWSLCLECCGRLMITFKLKKAAHWNDGTPVTADDVAYTWAYPCQVQGRRRC